MATARPLVEACRERRASPLPAMAAAAWALLFAASSAYWAAGGMLGSETVANDLAERVAARDPGFVATLWAAAALKASLALLALALTRRWGARSGRILRSRLSPATPAH